MSNIMLNLEDFFATHAVFNSTELIAFLEKRGTGNIHSQKALLAYHVSAQHLLKIKRGLYAVVPRPYAPDNCPVDSYLIAGKFADDAVLAYHTALEFHGVAYSVFEHFTFLTHKIVPPLRFRTQLFRAVRFPVTLMEKTQENYGVEAVNRSGVEIRITNLERTFVDVLDKPNLAGGWEEISNSLDMIAVLDLNKVLDYSLVLNNATTIAKVGFFLERNQKKLGVTDQQLSLLEKHSPKRAHYLDRNRRHAGKLIKRWNLMIPEEVLEKTWEEPF